MNNDDEIYFQCFLPATNLKVLDDNTFDDIMPFEVSEDFTRRNKAYNLPETRLSANYWVFD